MKPLSLAITVLAVTMLPSISICDTGQEIAGTRAGEERAFEIADGVEMMFCWVPAGTFQMGSPEDELGRYTDEGPVREVGLTKGYWLAKNPVTQGEWQAVMGSNPSRFTKDVVGADTSRHPVESLSWDDICGDEQRTGGFLGRVNALAPAGWRFDLPTEAQWEYACRAGTTSALNNGKDLSSWRECENLDEVAWYRKNTGSSLWKSGSPDHVERQTQPVGGKAANAWGLQDMHGNVAEWCRDWWADSYADMETVDPEGPATGHYRVYRGGLWASHAPNCRAAYRFRGRPGLNDGTRILDGRLGFRPVLVPSGDDE